MFLDSWFPYYDVTKTLDEMDRLLNAVNRPLGLRSVPRGTFPAVNVYDQGSKALLTAELPGVDPDKLELTVRNDTVTLKGERSADKEKVDQYYRRERPMGTFERTLTLPASISPQSVNAEYKNGILKVTMEKAESEKARKIPIHS